MMTMPRAVTPKNVRSLAIRAILFDIGDTLLHASNLLKMGVENAAQELANCGFIREPKRFVDTYWEADKAIQGPRINHLFSDLIIIKKVWSKLNVKESYAAFGVFLTALRRSVREHIVQDKELISFFELLKNKQAKLGIVSDGTTNEQLETLTKLGIIKYLDIIVISEEFNLEKPDPILFEHALYQLKTKPTNTLMVGDDPIRDIAGPKKMGIKTALVTKYSEELSKTEFRVNPDIIVHDVQEILDSIIINERD